MEDDLKLLAPYFVPESELPLWTPDPIAVPTRHHELCPDCEGKKLCPDCGGPGSRHPYCTGWCRVCGGAGQIPVHPHVPLVRPPPEVDPYPRPAQVDPWYRARRILAMLRARRASTRQEPGQPRFRPKG